MRHRGVQIPTGGMRTAGAGASPKKPGALRTLQTEGLHSVPGRWGSGTPLILFGQGSGGSVGLLWGLDDHAVAIRGAHPTAPWLSRGFPGDIQRRGSRRGLSCSTSVRYVRGGQSPRGPSLAPCPVPLLLLWRKRREGFGGAGSAPAGTLGAPAGRQGWTWGGGEARALARVSGARSQDGKFPCGARGLGLELPGPGQPLPHAAASQGSAPPRVPVPWGRGRWHGHPRCRGSQGGG